MQRGRNGAKMRIGAVKMSGARMTIGAAGITAPRTTKGLRLTTSKHYQLFLEMH